VCDVNENILQKIHDWLTAEGVTFRAVSHEPCTTSEQSAQARNEPIEIGGKALLLKVWDEFKLFVLSAALRLDSGAVRKHFGVKGVRFASREELMELTGLVPGSVPPFGRPILPFDLFIDESIAGNDRIAFNAGSLTDSIVMTVADYLRLANPTVLRFGMEA